MNAEEKPHQVEIIVNGRPRTIEGDEVSFEEAVKLAFPQPPPGDNIVYTVAYRKAAGDRSGDLVKGQSVKVKEGTIFDVTATDKS
jgi:Multiubiquitin